MEATGQLSKINRYGQIIIPAKIRLLTGIKENDFIEFFTDGNDIILKRRHVCVFCGNTSSIKDYSGKLVCRDCVRDIYNRTKSM